MNYYNCDMASYLHYLNQCIQLQQQKIDQLENALELLQTDFETFKQQNNGKPDRIEYKFDQLKVERLEGTLNIGITPTGGVDPNSFEDFSITRNKIDVPNLEVNEAFLQNVKKQIHAYLSGDCFTIMKSMERHYQYQLDQPYRNFIIEDIRNQIDERIQHYLQKIDWNNISEEQLHQLELSTVNKVKDDINRTIEEFMKHLPMKGES